MLNAEGLRREIESDIVAVVDNVFFRGLIDGSLAPETFTGFLTEDARFLRRLARLYAVLASRSESPGLYGPVSGLAAGLPGAIDALYVPAFQRRGISLDQELARPMSALNEVYLKVMSGYVRDESLVESVAYMLPILVHHEIVGERVRAKNPHLPDTEYGQWLREFGVNPHFRMAVRGIEHALDQLLASATQREQEAVVRAYRLASYFEVVFWDGIVSKDLVAPRLEIFPRTLFEARS